METEPAELASSPWAKQFHFLYMHMLHMYIHEPLYFVYGPVALLYNELNLNWNLFQEKKFYTVDLNGKCVVVFNSVYTVSITAGWWIWKYKGNS